MHEKLYFAVCDDEPEALAQICEALRKALHKLEYRTNCALQKFTSGAALYETGLKERFHLIFLDIEMPNLNGFQLAEKLHLIASDAYIVFVSGYENYVHDVFGYAPLAFVRKSALDYDVYRAIYLYFQRTSYLHLSVRLKDGIGYKELLVKDILYVECEGHRLTYITVVGGSVEAYGTLKAIEEELSIYGFLRVHKSYLVNQRYVESVGKREILLAGGRSVDMGKERRKEVQAAMFQYAEKREKNGI